MEVAYYNLSGGINQALTKTELGIDTKKIYWADAENVEILQNRGIVKQKGNSLFLEIYRPSKGDLSIPISKKVRNILILSVFPKRRGRVNRFTFPQFCKSCSINFVLSI